jgi:homoaconitase/3-isopropylmalate dehydratase large subunit
MKFDLNGQMPDYLLAKDIILQIIGDIGVAGATYRSMEFGGDAIGQVPRTPYKYTHATLAMLGKKPESMNGRAA